MTPAWIQPEPSTPQERIRAIHGSLRAFTLAWVGMIPLLGIPFAVAAFAMALGPTLRDDDGWNAAGRYRLTALWMSGLMLLLEAGVISVAILAAMKD